MNPRLVLLNQEYSKMYRLNRWVVRLILGSNQTEQCRRVNMADKSAQKLLTCYCNINRFVPIDKFSIDQETMQNSLG